MEIEMTNLYKTWILDLDGTILKHNGYKIDGEDSLLDGAVELLAQIKEDDMVIFVTSRKLEYRQMTETFLAKNEIRFDHIIYEAPYGERILVNDDKPSGRSMAYAFGGKRDEVVDLKIKINDKL